MKINFDESEHVANYTDFPGAGVENSTEYTAEIPADFAENCHAYKLAGGVLTLDTAKQEAAQQAQTNAQRIGELKSLLFESDYKAIKFAEGRLTAEEYEPDRVQRQAWRDEINALEGAEA